MIIPGLHLLSHQFGTADSPKLELLELGASAGLNQFPDRIGVDYETFSLGPAEPRLSLQAKWTGQPIPSAPFSVISRRGCDLNPIDATSPTGTLRLQSYVWPDQMERLIRLRKAIELAQLDPPSIDRSNAAQWLSRELSRPQIADLRVVFHSYVWIYLSANERAEISAMMDDAGARADHRHQLAWLHLEDDETGHRHFMTLTCWPNKRKTVLAHGSPHGQWLHWYDESQRN